MRATRRARLTAIAALALLLPLAACGSSGGDDAKSNDKTATDKAADSGDESSDSGDDSSKDSGDQAKAELPDPCTLVPLDRASEILGGKSAEPDSQSNDLGIPTRTCSWQTQESVDNPSLETAGHILTLSVSGPPESSGMSIDEYFDAASSGKTEDGDVCDKSFWLGGALTALQDGVYLTGSAGLNSTTPEAKQAVTDLMTAACEGV